MVSFKIKTIWLSTIFHGEAMRAIVKIAKYVYKKKNKKNQVRCLRNLWTMLFVK